MEERGVYFGGWVGGMKHGQGNLNFADKRRYHGQFFQDKKQGRGTYIW